MRVDKLFIVQPTESESSSQYVGEKAKRAEFILTLDKTIPLTEGYSVAIYCWHDREQNQFVWFASKLGFDYQVGEEYRIRATVKDHRMYRGIRQTIINRLKLIQHCYRPFVSKTTELTGHETTVNDAWENL